MGLNVYYPQDILNALQAAEQSASAAIGASGEGDAYQAGYLAGYRAALVTIGLAFGLVGRQRGNNTPALGAVLFAERKEGGKL